MGRHRKASDSPVRRSVIMLSGLVPAGVAAATAAPAAAAPLAQEIALPTGSASGSSDSGSAAAGSSGRPTPGVPFIAEVAYRTAAFQMAMEQPQCNMSWEILAGIGKVESHHANNGDVDMRGTARHGVHGPVLNGSLAGNEVVRNKSGGFQRAEGPMQFMPGTWRHYAKPGADPQNMFDAAYAAGNYLCSGGLDMRDPAQRTKAILRYNHSMAYVANVMAYARAYQSGTAVNPRALPRI
ncbi:MAG: lytic transglycosylase domain-containing protein [Mycobacteriaceae bacterium]|nr:lytic transglycosylase domain-containing protein [Mycobacteriaceae bacterium]